MCTCYLLDVQCKTLNIFTDSSRKLLHKQQSGGKYGNCDDCRLQNKASPFVCLGECFCLRFQQCFLWLYSRHFAWHDVFNHKESLDALPLPCPHLPPSVSLTLPLPLPSSMSLCHSNIDSYTLSTLIWDHFIC